MTTWFNGNKIVTTSGGGMLLSNNQIAVEKMRFWATQAREPFIHYEHKEYGYNYRMSNICACIGRGQLAFLPEKLQIRKRLHATYLGSLAGLPAYIKQTAEKGCSNHWLNLLVLDTHDILPSEIVTKLQNAQIETRPAWKPMHMQPVFKAATFFSHTETGKPSIGEYVFAHAVCLPSGDGMSSENQQEVVDEIRKCFANAAAV
jgi:pyridoxal phosphate-dependent aminotransferase EpsN